jgi:S-adenosylmethionine decarboxylase
LGFSERASERCFAPTQQRRAERAGERRVSAGRIACSMEEQMTGASRLSMAALLEDLQSREQNRAAAHALPACAAPAEAHGFVRRDGMRFAGTHLILDLWQARDLTNVEVIEAALRRAAEEAGATVLSVDLHSFTPNAGVTGVAILAESHISIHTWPEHAYAAIDIFMCGRAEPHKAIGILRDSFEPQLLTISEHRRGLMP